MSIGYFWAPILRRERPPGIGEYTIAIVLVPLEEGGGGHPRIRVLSGNEDVTWAVAWIREELEERRADRASLVSWWQERAACTEDAVRLGPPAPGSAEDADIEIDSIFGTLRERSPWARAG